MAFYPKIPDDQLMQFRVVVQNMLKDPEYLKSEECPYSREMVEFLTTLRPPEVQDIFGDAVDGDEAVLIDDQLKTIINDLEAMGASMVKADPKDRIDYYKAKTAMYDKLVTMRDKANNIKAMYDFQSTILGFMDEVLTKDQVTALMKRLDDVR